MGAWARRRNDERTQVSRRGDDGPIAHPAAAIPGATVPAEWIARASTGPAAAWGARRPTARRFPALASPAAWLLALAGSASRAAMDCATRATAASLPGRRSRDRSGRIPATAAPSALAMVGCGCGRRGGDGAGDHAGGAGQQRVNNDTEVSGAVVHPCPFLEQTRADVIGDGRPASGAAGRHCGLAQSVSVCRTGQHHTQPCADEPA